jgi:hypothetical protein
LIDGRHSPAREGALQRVAWPLAFDGHYEALFAIEVA